MSKRRYSYTAHVVQLAENERRALGKHTFEATTLASAKRTASQWCGELLGLVGIERTMSFGPWEILTTVDSNDWFRGVGRDKALVLKPTGSQESAQTTQGLIDLMWKIRAEPQLSHWQGDKDLLAKIEQYFRHCLDETGGNVTDEMRRDADLIYDWPGAPAMIARAWGCTLHDVRGQLGRARICQCPKCKETRFSTQARCKGGFTTEGMSCYCRKCGTLLGDELWTVNERGGFRYPAHACCYCIEAYGEPDTWWCSLTDQPAQNESCDCPEFRWHG